MNLINFTIIIPHYNIPQLLIRCINSIPIRPDIQVIVVDDCSPGSDSYFDLYPEFKRPYLEWYSTPKGGSAGRARNIGLDHAKGKWVLLIDADDFFTFNIEEVLNEALNREEDILFYNYDSVYSDDISQKTDERIYLQEYFVQYKKDHDEIPFRFQFEPIWCKIIRKDMIDRYHIRCDETKYANDVGFSVKIGYYARNIGVINKTLFVITQRSGFLGSSFYKGNTMHLDELRTRMLVAVKDQNFLDKRNIGIELNTFLLYKKKLLEKYQNKYLGIMVRYLFLYPFACKRLFVFWFSWKIKAIKNTFEKRYS